jgi:hypothetical protein
MRSVHEAQRHTVKLSVFLDYVLKSYRGKRRGGNPKLELQSAATSGDRRYAARSACHPEYNRIAFLFDFFPQICGVISKNKPRLAF